VETRKNRMAVGGLRKADPSTLEILAADVLRRPLGQIDPATLMDLLALSEVPDQVGGQLAKEFTRFRDQMFREIADLPDGPVVADFCAELRAVDAAQIPKNVRNAFSEMLPEVRTEEAVGGIEALLAHVEGTEPAAVALPMKAEPLPATKETGAGTPRKQVIKAKTKTTKRRSTVVDDRREAWIREDAIARLKNWGAKGLKESIVVAGARHRAPWKDLTEAEVLATLRKMKREGQVRFSAGRWMVA
jgi:hypothetical protein